MNENQQFQVPKEQLFSVKTNKKALDFREYLTPAPLESYARMYVSKGAAKSVIKLFLTDFSNGTGNSSITVDTSLGVEDVIRLREAVKHFEVPTGTQMPATLPAELQECSNLVAMVGGNLNCLSPEQMAWLANKIAAMSQMAASASAGGGNNPVWGNAPGKAQTEDYEMKMERLHSFKMDASGRAPMNYLSITHISRDANGNAVNYPWNIKITKGTAVVRSGSNGSKSAEPRSFVKEAEVFMRLSQSDMFSAMERCYAFIKAFEMSQCVPVIAQAMIKKREDAANRQQNAYSQNAAPAAPATPQNQPPQWGKQVQYSAAPCYPPQNNVPNPWRR